MPISVAGKRVHRRATQQSGPESKLYSEVPFFIAAIIFLVLVTGGIIVAQKYTISYLSRESPRVAQYNYQVLQANLAAVEERLTQQIVELKNMCRVTDRPVEPPALPLSEPIIVPVPE